ncbi:MAG TPA: hypothetical protein VGL93_00730 [Streptosporangiaceae bacterium]|jgi:hypothetical protein
MSVREAPISLARPRPRRGCLGALGFVAVGVLICAIAATALTWTHTVRTRQWHPYGAKGPVVTVWRAYTWAGGLHDGLLGGHDRYEMRAGADPSGRSGDDVPVPRGFGPRHDDLAKVTVTGDAHGVTVTFPGKEHAFVPKARLKAR